MRSAFRQHCLSLIACVNGEPVFVTSAGSPWLASKYSSFVSSRVLEYRKPAPCGASSLQANLRRSRDNSEAPRPSTTQRADGYRWLPGVSCSARVMIWSPEGSWFSDGLHQSKHLLSIRQVRFSPVQAQTETNHYSM